MPALRDVKREAFAQALSDGLSLTDAHAKAGYKPDRGNAFRLQHRDDVAQRIAELREQRSEVERRATAKAVERAVETLAITKERVLEEYKRIAFTSIGRLIRWGDAVAVPHHETGEPQLVQGVYLLPADEIGEDALASISEIRQTKEGLAVKQHSKTAALEKLARFVGLDVPEPVDVTVDMPLPSKLEVARRLAFLMTAGAKEIG